ncbi:MAG: AbrB/MazE/SpoVT family DNA-binding domain-containing protein [Spirochaetales bacterium]|nr:AbrB/MazE/SpoVT family DNA-binding domain-containing protein [Spirochaetales bacterium]
MDKFMSNVKIGPKGQIVIPSEVRKMFNLKPGDSLILLAAIKQGIGLNTYEAIASVMKQNPIGFSSEFKETLEKVEEDAEK